MGGATMNPKKPKRRASFPSRHGIPNSRRRPVDERTLAGEIRALQRRRRAMLEMGFSDVEAGAFMDALSLRGKHLRVPVHARDQVPISRVHNPKPGMEFKKLVGKWNAPLTRFHHTLSTSDPIHGVAVDRATHLFADTIRFFGQSYSGKIAQQFALNYLAGANITIPRAPREIAIEREQMLPFFHRFQQFMEGRASKFERVLSLRRDARALGYRIGKSRK